MNARLWGTRGSLPTPDPKASADELERCVTKLGFKGAMIMGTTQGRFIDEKLTAHGAQSSTQRTS